MEDFSARIFIRHAWMQTRAVQTRPIFIRTAIKTVQESLIFDLDGTLWDAIDACVVAWNNVLRQENISSPVDRTQLLTSMGKTEPEICELYFTHLPFLERRELLQKCFAREIPTFYKTPPMVYPGVLEGLRKLQSRYRLAIVSNCQRGYLDAFMDLNGLGDTFDFTLCFEDTGEPKAENLQTAITQLELPVAGFIGDTLSDQRAADSARCPFYFASYGFGAVEKSLKVFSDFSELTDFFNNMVSARPS